MGIEHALPPGDREDEAKEEVDEVLRAYTGSKTQERINRGAQMILDRCNHDIWWRAAAFERARKSPYNRKDFGQWAGLVEFYWGVLSEASAKGCDDPLAGRFVGNLEGVAVRDLTGCGVAFPIVFKSDFKLDSGVVWVGDASVLDRAKQAGQLALYASELREFGGLEGADKETLKECWHGFWKVRKTLGNGDGNPILADTTDLFSTVYNDGDSEGVSS